MLHFFEHTFNVPQSAGGPVTIPATINITRPNPSPNARVLLALKAFDVSYKKGDDHHLLRVFIRPELDGFGPFKNTVPVRLSFGMRDSSGNWDDPYQGVIKIGVIVIDDNNVDVFNQAQQFPYLTGRGPQTETTYLQLNDPSASSVTFLTGFDIAYEQDDHHILQISADVNDQVISVPGSRFDAVQCRLGLRDDSGFWDDPYGGAVLFSSMKFPKGKYEVEDGYITVQGANSGPVISNADHYIQANLPQENLFVGLTGFHSEFIGGDHHIYRLVSDVKIDQVVNEPDSTQIRVQYTGGLRDASGNWDDQYASTGMYTILADLEKITAPLSIAGGFKIPEAWLKKMETEKGHRRFLHTPSLS